MHKTPEITRLIHENLEIVLSFAFAQPGLTALLDERSRGEWNYLRKSVHEIGEVSADRALLELGTQIRVLDDAEGEANYLEQVSASPFGVIAQPPA